MEPLKIKKLCDADFCACSPMTQATRETTTIAECEQIYRQANEKGDVGHDADAETA